MADFTRCDAFTLMITANVSGDVTAVRANLTPGATVPLAGNPLEATLTLPPGEYSVSVTATGPAGTTSRNLGKVLHICPG